jgi:hypothetical protein
MKNDKKEKEKKLIVESKKIEEKFIRIAKGINPELKIIKEHKTNYVNIKRDGKIIGCIMYHYNNIHFEADVKDKDKIVFEFHSTHPRGRERKPLIDLNDKCIETAIRDSQRKRS